ncbi:MAG TPA: energy transducer TonB [Steroidobacteraceae bacterium]|jgi:protein TonB|nr:energy transducer TonB [Steroidobacteraceae bacterium]
MGVYVHDNQWATRRSIVFVGIILFHILLYWGVKSGFVGKALEAVAPPIETEIIEETVDDNTPPPPPPPEMERPPIEVPPPVVDINIPVEAANNTALTNTTTERLPPPPAPVVVASVVRVPPRLNPKASQPDTDEYYPPSSKRLGEQGNAVVKSCVGENGRITEVTVDTTSGVARLDEAALKYARVLRYLPGTENGKPIPACFSFRVRFQLKD